MNGGMAVYADAWTALGEREYAYTDISGTVGLRRARSTANLRAHSVSVP